jgi:hypothetical protein
LGSRFFTQALVPVEGSPCLSAFGSTSIVLTLRTISTECAYFDCLRIDESESQSRMSEKELQSRADRELTLKGRRPKAFSDLRKKDDLHPALLGQRLQSSAERLTVDIDIVFCRFGTRGRTDQSRRAPGCNEKTPQYRSRCLEFHDARLPSVMGPVVDANLNRTPFARGRQSKFDPLWAPMASSGRHFLCRLTGRVRADWFGWWGPLQWMCN